MGLQKRPGPWSGLLWFKSSMALYGAHIIIIAGYFGLKAEGPYRELLFHNNGQIYEHRLSLHRNLCEEVAM